MDREQKSKIIVTLVVLMEEGEADEYAFHENSQNKRRKSHIVDILGGKGVESTCTTPPPENQTV
jgi:hypothetical protein